MLIPEFPLEAPQILPSPVFCCISFFFFSREALTEFKHTLLLTFHQQRKNEIKQARGRILMQSALKEKKKDGKNSVVTDL